MAYKSLCLSLTSLFIALTLTMAAIASVGFQANGGFSSGAHVSTDTIDYLKEPAQLGIAQSLLQTQLVRPARTAFGNNETPLRASPESQFPNTLQPHAGFVLHLFPVAVIVPCRKQA